MSRVSHANRIIRGGAMHVLVAASSLGRILLLVAFVKRKVQ